MADGSSALAATEAVEQVTAVRQLQDFRPMTDLGNAERMVEQNSRVIRYLQDREQWRAWVSPVWRRGEMGPMYLAAYAMARSIQDEAWQLSSVPNQSPVTGNRTASDQGLMLAHAKTSESRRGADSAIALAAHILPVSCRADIFDVDPWLLNTPNGIVNLRTGRSSPCRPEAMMTRCTRGRCDPMAKSPIWNNFIDEITCGDAELAAYLQRAIGQTLIGTQLDHVFFFCFGDGRNGKGKFVGALLHALGDYAMTLPANMLIEKQHESHPTELADLEGTRMAIGTEVPNGAAWDEVRIKSLSGGDPIRARRMRKDFIEFEASHSFWVTGNDKPRIRGKDKGIWRRMRLIPFMANIPDEKEDPHLPAKLAREADGVLRWALEGCRIYLQDGLGTCDAVVAATAAYHDDEDFVGQFLEECCVTHEDCNVSKSDLRASMIAWMQAQGYKQPTERALKSDFARRKVTDYRTGSDPWRWKGVGLKARAESAPYQGGHYYSDN